MRSKEDAHDYRYFPDPDPLVIDTAWIERSGKRSSTKLGHCPGVARKV
jgi:Asp-tRNA(Asn)/Glu-tRNA(Gln) amidotransferase B subunit